MNAQRVFIRADASPTIGYGHFVRCLSLAHMLSAEFLVTFYMNHPPGDVVDQVTASGFGLIPIASEEELFKDLASDVILVADGYSFREDFDARVRYSGCILVSIDDYADRFFAADVVINHAPGTTSAYFRISDSTRLLSGTEYALLRPLFLAQASKERTGRLSNELVICFGGSDSMNLTMSTLKQVINFGHWSVVTVIVGGGYMYMNELAEFVIDKPGVKVIRNADEMQMKDAFACASLAIVPSSGVLFEAIACKTPVISGYYVSNQQMIYHGFRQRNAFYDAADFSEDALVSALTEAKASNPDELIKNHSALIDGRSGERLCAVFKDLASR